MPTTTTTYSTSEPTYGFSSATTEFDDELIKRNIVSLEQCIMAKGATEPQAHHLAQQKRQPKPTTIVDYNNPQSAKYQKDKNERDTYPDNDDDDIDVDDYDKLLDDFETINENNNDDENDEEETYLEHYKQERLQALKREQLLRSQGRWFGEAYYISRQDWTHHVNDTSRNNVWVVVGLTSSDVLRTGCLERAMTDLASKCPTTKFVLIPAHQAIANPHWPQHNLPCLFLYQNGTMKHELIQLNHNITTTELQDILDQLHIFQTTTTTTEE